MTASGCERKTFSAPELTPFCLNDNEKTSQSRRFFRSHSFAYARCRSIKLIATSSQIKLLDLLKAHESNLLSLLIRLELPGVGSTSRKLHIDEIADIHHCL